MNDSFDAIRYIGYLRGRWRTIAASAAIAVAIALAVSLMMSPQYTATARTPPARWTSGRLAQRQSGAPIHLARGRLNGRLFFPSSSMIAIRRLASSESPMNFLPASSMRACGWRSIRA